MHLLSVIDNPCSIIYFLGAESSYLFLYVMLSDYNCNCSQKFKINFNETSVGFVEMFPGDGA